MTVAIFYLMHFTHGGKVKCFISCEMLIMKLCGVLPTFGYAQQLVTMGLSGNNFGGLGVVQTELVISQIKILEAVYFPNLLRWGLPTLMDSKKIIIFTD